MPQIFSSAQPLLQALASASLLERYRALSVLSDVTCAQGELGALHELSQREIERVLQGPLAHTDRTLMLRAEENLEAIDGLLRNRPDLLLVRSHERFREIVDARPSDDMRLFHQPNSIRSLLKELGPDCLPTDVHLMPPRIVVFRDCQPLLMEDQPGPLFQTRLYLRYMGERFFGKPLMLEDLLAGFVLNIPGYQLTQLDLEFMAGGCLDIRGSVSAVGGNGPVASFHRSVPARPGDGSPWIARSHGIRVTDAALQRRGIGRHLTQRLMAFLSRLGVDALEFTAYLSGALVFPRIGFDFAHDGVRDIMKIRLRELIRMRDLKMDRADEDQWARIQHAWELAGFCLDNQSPIGLEFLMAMGTRGAPPGFPVRFWTREDYEGWGHLFCHRTPPEWNLLHANTRRALHEYHRLHDQMHGILTSFDKHVRNLHEAFGNWIIPVSFYLRSRDASNHLHMLPAEEVGEFHDQFVHTAHLIAWMASDEVRRTPLGRAFWKRMRPAGWDFLPLLAAAAKEILDLEIQIPKPDDQDV